LNADVQPLLRSPTMMLGRRIVVGRSLRPRTSSSASNLACSYELRNACETSRSRSKNRPRWVPATYAV